MEKLLDVAATLKGKRILFVGATGFVGKVALSLLLRRYPEIAEEERLELLEFLTNGSQEEIVQVAHLQGIEPRFLQFRSDHPKEFRTGFRGWLPMILFIVVAVIGIIWRMSL